MEVDESGSLLARQRVVIPSRVRNALLVEQRGRCCYCGRRMSNRQLEIHHMWPVNRDGGNERRNLGLVCTACNLRKGIQTDEEFRNRYQRLLPTDESIPDPLRAIRR
ncbi:MAG: HNH endonuclease [Chloroflexi bacterium]|nr:HNH endonuclease [Chloroflexota bacterium]